MTNHPNRNRSKQQRATHTPGPWHHKHDDYAKNVINVEAAGHVPIARLTGIAAARDESEVNARLIAAAPELLAALKSLYSEFKAYRPDCFEAAERAELESPDMILDGNGNLHAMRGSTVVIVLGARRAVAKAEGR